MIVLKVLSFLLPLIILHIIAVLILPIMYTAERHKSDDILLNAKISWPLDITALSFAMGTLKGMERSFELLGIKIGILPIKKISGLESLLRWSPRYLTR